MFTEYLKCERNFTDTDGHMVSCSASLPDIFVENSVYLGCKVETRLPNNKLLKLNAPFTLPECGIDSSKVFFKKNVLRLIYEHFLAHLTTKGHHGQKLGHTAQI
jgi:hypothetical protein